MKRTHEKVSDAPDREDRACLGPGGSAARVQRALRVLEGRWKLDIVFQLFAYAPAPIRFSELERNIEGISQKMLVTRLQELERDGLLKRTQHAEIPPRVDYALTERGESLRPALLALRDLDLP